MSNFWTINITLAFLLCMLLVGFAIPQILRLAFRKKLFDYPDRRKIHHDMTPRLGGTTFVPVVLFSFVILLVVSKFICHGEIVAETYAEAQPLAALFLAQTISYLLGLLDDVKGVEYQAKFLAQAFCAILVIFGGVWLSNLHLFQPTFALSQLMTILLTIFVMVFVINAINLIDGIDGLASGLCLVAFVCYGVAFIYFRLYVYAMLAFAFVGVLVAFFYYNVFGIRKKRRRIFMGDTGSLTLGIMLCFMSIRLTQIPEGVPPHVNKLVLAFSPLLIPCFDVVRVFLYRLLHGNNPFKPDKNHIHHRLMETGIGQHYTMVVIILSSVVLTVLNIILSKSISPAWLMAADIILWTVANAIINYIITTKRNKLRQTSN